MVTINRESFTITVPCSGGGAIENLIETHSQLIDALQAESDEMKGNRFYYLELLRAMMPSPEDLERMLQKKVK